MTGIKLKQIEREDRESQNYDTTASDWTLTDILLHDILTLLEKINDKLK